MPLIKVDYNEKILGDEVIDALIQKLLTESKRIYEASADEISIFSTAYGKHTASTAAAEIEVRAKVSRYDKSDISPDDLREKHMEEFKTFLEKFIADYKIQQNIVFTITFENWQVEWLRGTSK